MNCIIIGVILTLFNLVSIIADDETCDRRPLGTKTDHLPPDNRFRIDIDDIQNERYIPGKTYTVRLFATDNQSTFIAFTISAREDTKINEKNPRKPLPLDPGTITTFENSLDTILSPKCNNAVIQSNIVPKSSVEVKWIAPPKDNKCVTIYALLAIKPNVWYNFEGPLSKRVCEDQRKKDDMQPPMNENCAVCEEARYQLIFEGLWTYNTHTTMYPTNPDSASFSDIIGASHSTSFQLWKFNTEASAGLRMLAEHYNTTQLEVEIQKEIYRSVRTVIKATGLVKPNINVTAFFRVNKDMHCVSLLTAIMPSPDWFLGVANFELCDATTGSWVESIRYNLYPNDAGTDSGKTFDAPNEATSPPQPIDVADFIKYKPTQDLQPFARLHFNLIRTYSKPNCIKETDNSYEIRTDSDRTGINEGYDYETNNYVPNEQTGVNRQTTTEEPAAVDPDSPDNCPMTPWDDWLDCEGACDNGRIKGYHTRLRYHIVDGITVGKHSKNGNEGELKIPDECIDRNPTAEIKPCDVECEVEENAETQLQPKPLSPGSSWG